MSIHKSWVSGAAFAILALLAPSVAQAGTIFTVSSPNGPDGPVSASAEFTLGVGTVHIALTNLLANPTSDGQLISGLDFVISGATGPGTLNGASGLISFVNPSNGTYTAGLQQDLTKPYPHNPDGGKSIWSLVSQGELTTLSGKKPEYLIIGPDNHGHYNPSLGGLYSASNSSILQHNPVVLGTGTFDLTMAGVTANSKITGVSFEFGTGPFELPSDPPGIVINAVPEPSSLALGGLGIILTLLFRRIYR
jgi:hypothetical protein